MVGKKIFKIIIYGLIAYIFGSFIRKTYILGSTHGCFCTQKKILVSLKTIPKLQFMAI